MWLDVSRALLAAKLAANVTFLCDDPTLTALSHLSNE
jgi:hypothetical protein